MSIFQVDRSPTGSGVTARMALLHEQGLVELNELITFISGVNGSQFYGKLKESRFSIHTPKENKKLVFLRNLKRLGTNSWRIKHETL